MGTFFFFFFVLCSVSGVSCSSFLSLVPGWRGSWLGGCVPLKGGVPWRGEGLNQGLEPGESASPHRLWPSEPPRSSSRTDPPAPLPLGPRLLWDLGRLSGSQRAVW